MIDLSVTLACFFTGSQSLESQIQNMVQKHQSQVKQHLLSQNNIPLTGVPNFFGSSSALPSFGGNSQATVPSVPFQQTPMVQSLFNATPNAAGNLIGKGWPTSDMSQVAQRQGMQQQSLAHIHSQQLLQLANASVRDTRQGIQSTDTAPQQQTTIDQQKRLMQNLQSQRDVRLQPFRKFSLLNDIKCIEVISGILDTSVYCLLFMLAIDCLIIRPC